MTTLTEIANHPEIQKNYGVLARSGVELVASPQIRNQGTLGGNVSQDARCWYYRGGWPCYRAGGNICYADTPVGRNREHAIFGADRCVAVHPSDSAPALIALDAKFVVQTPKGERVVDAEDYFIGPEIDITRMNILRARRSADGDSHSVHVGGREVLFREGARPQRVGFSADERGLGDEAAAATISSDIRIAVNAVAPQPDAAEERWKTRCAASPPTRKRAKWPESWRSRARCRCNSTPTRFR